MNAIKVSLDKVRMNEINERYRDNVDSWIAEYECSFEMKEIEELIYSYIQNDMTEKIDVIELNGKAANDFKTLRSMALDLNNYFNSFLCGLKRDSENSLSPSLNGLQKIQVTLKSFFV